MQEIAEEDAQTCDVGDEILFADDALHFKGAGAGDGVALVGVAVGKCAAGRVSMVTCASTRFAHPVPADSASATLWLIKMPATGT